MSNFHIKQNTNNACYFQFFDQNNELVLLSDYYPDKLSVKQAIQDLRLKSLMDQYFIQAETDDGEIYFMIKNSNGDVLVKSVLYTSEKMMNEALQFVKDNACRANMKFWETTLPKLNKCG